MEPPVDPEAHLDATFAALADPTRRALVSALLAGDRTVSDLAAPFAMSLAAVSKHLGILIRAGLVEQRREGRVKWCRLNPDTVRPAAVWMEAFGRFADTDFDRLEVVVDALADAAATRAAEPESDPQPDGPAA